MFFIIGNKKYAASTPWDLQSQNLIVKAEEFSQCDHSTCSLCRGSMRQEVGVWQEQLAGFCVSKSVRLKLCVDGVKEDAACSEPDLSA